MKFEICVEGVDGAVAGEQGGGDRIELCASLVEGGITPSLGTVRATLGAVGVPVFAMVRPRGGDFLYSALEFASMLDDIAVMRDAGVAGVVFGCLTADGRVDEARTRALTERARPLGVTFHRAFDMTDDPSAALEALIRCGVDRVLTTGQALTALEGLATLRRLVEQAAGRIVVMACGGLRPDNIGTVVRETGVPELHFSTQIQVPSLMQYKKAALTMGGAPAEREFYQIGTDVDLVRATIAAARA
jgi:copper homeostasis protein